MRKTIVLTALMVVIGAGALGRAYGVPLAAAGARLSFVVRGSRLEERSRYVAERANGKRGVFVLDEPRRVASVPQDASVILLAVRREQVDRALERTIADAPAVPVVLLTPFLPHSEARLARLASGPCVVALPTVAARIVQERVQYFVPPFTKTLFESDAGRPEAVQHLLDACNRAGLPAAWSSGVSKRNPATTIAFFPLTVGLSVAGSMSSFLDAPELRRLTLSALRECLELAPRIGPVAAPLRLALSQAGPSTLRAAVGAARLVAPSLTQLLEDHFAEKLSAQHQVLGQEILELGAEHGVQTRRLSELLALARAD